MDRLPAPSRVLLTQCLREHAEQELMERKMEKERELESGREKAGDKTEGESSGAGRVQRYLDLFRSHSAQRLRAGGGGLVYI